MTWGFVIWLCLTVAPDQCVMVRSTPDYPIRAECAADADQHIRQFYLGGAYVARWIDCYKVDGIQ